MRVFITAAVVLFAFAANAQTIVINPQPGASSAPAKAQRVSINITLVTPASTGTPNDLTAGMTAANQSLYAIVNHECDVLGPLLQGNCHLVALTTNGGMNERVPTFGQSPGTPSVNVSANATFELEPKSLPISR